MTAPFFRILRLTLIAAFLTGLASLAPAQGNDIAGVKARRKALLEGTHVFRRILHDNDFSPLSDFASLAENPKQSVVVVLGDLDRIQEIRGGLNGFIRDGGAALLA